VTTSPAEAKAELEEIRKKITPENFAEMAKVSSNFNDHRSLL
jgi:hypothetical protein